MINKTGMLQLKYNETKNSDTYIFHIISVTALNTHAMVHTHITEEKSVI
jgi:hypothetical protein